jgi:hypothetical protein
VFEGTVMTKLPRVTKRLLALLLLCSACSRQRLAPEAACLEGSSRCHVGTIQTCRDGVPVVDENCAVTGRACAESAGADGTPTATCVPVEDASDVGVEAASDAVEPGDVNLQDTPSVGGSPDTIVDDLAELPVDCETDPGAVGCPCSSGAFCDTGWCVLTRDGERCAEFCDDSCPDGFECKTVSAPGAGADVSTICVDRLTYLCMPCDDDGDCAALGFEGKDTCVSYGDAGSFCGVECTFSLDCPSGYECNGDGQCARVDGECSCAPLHIELEATTDCAATNERGSCKGHRACGAKSLSACDAKVPEAEVCDGEDNDCDGTTDEPECP